MKVGVFAFGFVGKVLVSFLAGQKKQINFVAVKENDPYTNDILDVCQNTEICVYTIDNINSDFTKSIIKDTKPEICFLLWWPDIVKSDVLNAVPGGIVNLHPSLLPFNRGMHPYYWSLVEGTPAGVSIHYIDEEIDSGLLLCQKKIETDITTTGSSLYEEAENEIISLFKQNYDMIVEGSLNATKVNVEEGTFHLKKELDNHSHIDLNKTYKARDLINIMRARTFPSGQSSFFYLDGQKYSINIKIEKCKK